MAYRELLGVPGGVRFSAAAFVLRLPISMLGLGTVFLVVASTGSYGLAGAVSATVALAQAPAGPPIGRLTDRIGQRRVVLPAIAVHAAGLVALLVLALLDAPVWTLFPAAAVYGAGYPPAGSLVRARWANALAGTPLLSVAYSVESILDELIFIIGPVLATALATGVAPAAGLLVAGGFAVLGAAALAGQRRTEPPRRPAGAAPHSSALRSPGLRVVAVAAAALGGLFGSLEVATVAFTAERGSPGAAGVVLALLAAGSMLSGLLYGAARWRVPLRRRFAAAAVALAAATLALPLADSIAVLAALGFVGGFAVSPTLIAVFGLVEELVPPAVLTEGLGWLSTGFGIGLAVASSLVGRLIDAYGARTGLLVPLGCGVLSALIALGGVRWLRPSGVPAG